MGWLVQLCTYSFVPYLNIFVAKIFIADECQIDCKNVDLLNPGWKNLDYKRATDSAGSCNLYEEQHGTSIPVMNDADEAQMVIEESSIISSTTDQTLVAYQIPETV